VKCRVCGRPAKLLLVDLVDNSDFTYAEAFCSFQCLLKHVEEVVYGP